MLRGTLTLALWAILAFYVTLVARDFFHYADKAIFLAVDDSEATVSYSLATEGRYGFLSSPMLAGTVRTHGPVNYGPWYFYLSAALIWFFGYSLTLVRSIHLSIILGTIVAAACYFRGRDRAAATALFGLGIVYCFDAAQWPMVRPDSLVSGCAVALVVCAGMGSTRWRPGWWFGAGLAAGCGALTHLIAWTLLPSAGIVFVVAALDRLSSREVGRDVRRDVIAGAAALAAGVAIAVTSFYASFGFRIQEQLAFLNSYRALTASTSPYSTVVLTHLQLAFFYLNYPLRFVLGGALVSAWVWFGYTVFRPTASRRAVRAYLLPPALAWTAYIVSIGWYPNYHQGYVILHNVLGWWTVAALVFVLLDTVRHRLPRTGEGIATFALVLLVFQGGRQVNWRLIERSDKMTTAESFVSVSDYVGRVLDPMPVRSVVWGSIIFGIEVPSRVQLVQSVDAFALAAKVPWPQRQALVPDFLVFGYPEDRDDVLSSLHGKGDSIRSRVAELLPRESFRLVSLVAAAPYGATRVYERTTDATPSMPSVSVYDAKHHSWLGRLGPKAEAVFEAVDSMPMQIGYGANLPPATTPRHTVTADLPEGPYLLRVDVHPGAGRGRKRLVAATPATKLRQSISELGPAGDFSAYLPTDRTLFLLINHPGGTMVVSQFDDGEGAALTAVTAMPVVGLLDPQAEVSRALPLPALSTWIPTKGVSAHEGSRGGVRIEGDDTAFGYQIASEVVPTAPMDKVTVKIKVTIEVGRICTGFLNASSATWLVAPDAVRDETTFTADSSGGFRVVFANCNAHAQGVRSRFVLEPGTYLIESVKFYVDRLVDAALNPAKAEEDLDIERTPLDPDVHLVPPTLRIGRRDLARPVEAMQPGDVEYKAALVESTAGGWSIKGKADGPYTYLLRSKERRFEAGTRLVVSGRVERGGVSIGLFKKQSWAQQINVETPGPFTVVMAPSSSGLYSVTIANDLPGGLDTSIVISKIGFLSAGQ